LVALELRQVLECPTDPLGSLGRRPLAGRGDPPRGGRRIVVELGLEGVDLGLGLGEEALEGRAAPVRCGPSPRPDPHPVLGDDGHRHQSVGEQRGGALGEEPVEDVGLIDPEGGQGVVVDADPAGKPAIGVVLGAQPIERPCAADPLECRVQPE
jgi:hypothetical protein